MVHEWKMSAVASSLLALVSLLLFSCQPPITPTTGGIVGHALFSGESDNSGITMSAESVDGSGKTLAVKQTFSMGIMTARAVAALCTTDANGAYSLTGLAAGTYTVYASSQNSLEKAVTTGVTVVAGKDVTAADLNLTPTGQISGKATLNGAASGNLGIVVYIAGTSYSAMTDDSGGYTISAVPASTGYVLVASTGNQGYDAAISTVNVTAGSITVPDPPLKLLPHVVVATTGSVSGTAHLNGAATGNTGIIVFLSGSSYITITGDSGSFSLAGVAPGSYTLVASKDTYVQQTSNITVTAGSAANAGTLNLASSTGSLSGTVSLSGIPSAGISVVLQGTMYSATTNNVGAFTLNSLAPGSYIILASKEGYGSATVGPVTVTSGNTANAGAIVLPNVLDVSTWLGCDGWIGSNDGAGLNARFDYPTGICTTNSFFIADTDNQIIRQVSLMGVVTTLAGSVNYTGGTDGTGGAARFYFPAGLATDGTNLYVADSYNHSIRKIVPATAVVTTIAGLSGTSGTANGTGGTARFYRPNGIAADSTNLYIADTYNHTIRKIVIATGVVTTLAGGASMAGSLDGTGLAARFNQPTGICTDGTNLYVTDLNNDCIRKVVISTGVVTTYAGALGASGIQDGIGNSARFSRPWGICTDGTNLYVTDMGNSTIRKINISSATVTTIAGIPGCSGDTDGMSNQARFHGPTGLVSFGSLYVLDSGSNTVRQIR